jgi:DNA-binding MarR family transcriptional regulator
MDGSPDTPTSPPESPTGGESPERRLPAPAPWQKVAIPSAEPALPTVSFAISTTGYELARRFHELLAPFGLEPRDFGLLQGVAASEGDSQQAIGERINIAPSRMVAFIDSLERRGLLERRQNPNDRRARALFLTAEGRELLARAFQMADELERAATQGLSPTERDQLLELLARVGAHVGIPRDVHPGMPYSALRDE